MNIPFPFEIGSGVGITLDLFREIIFWEDMKSISLIVKQSVFKWFVETLAHDYKYDLRNNSKFYFIGELMADQNEKTKTEEVKISSNAVYLTAIAVLIIVLVVSVFTGGFGFSKPPVIEYKNTTQFTPNMQKINEIKTLLENNVYLTTEEKVTAEFFNASEKSGYITINYFVKGTYVPITVSNDYEYIHGGTPIKVSDVKAQIDAMISTLEQEKVPVSVQKTDKPKVELYIMSYCPYGTQMQKGIISVLKTLGDKIDFETKFVDYIMHGEPEITENTRQYCIQKEQDEKYVSYLECFLKAGDAASCLNESKVDTTKLDACMKQTTEQYNITALYNDKNTWLSGYYPQYPVHSKDNDQYNVQGSPTLVVNGKPVSVGRSSAVLLDAICGHFNIEPKECEAVLSSQNPSAGFGLEGTSTSAGTCS